MLNTAHPEYEGLDFAKLHAFGLRTVIDGCNLWEPERVRSVGVEYVAIGRHAAHANRPVPSP